MSFCAECLDLEALNSCTRPIEECINAIIADLEAKLAALNQKIADKELLVNEQNSDLQDAYSRYMNAMNYQCDMKLNTILENAKNEHIMILNQQNQANQREIEEQIAIIKVRINEITKNASLSMLYIKHFNNEVQRIEENWQNLLKQTRVNMISSIKMKTAQSLKTSILNQIKNQYERYNAHAVKLETKNSMLQQVVDKSNKEKNDVMSRIHMLCDEIFTLESNIIIAKQQRPLPKFDKTNNIIVSIEPNTKKSQGHFGGFRIVAPIHTFGRNTMAGSKERNRFMKFTRRF